MDTYISFYYHWIEDGKVKQEGNEFYHSQSKPTMSELKTFVRGFLKEPNAFIVLSGIQEISRENYDFGVGKNHENLYFK